MKITILLNFKCTQIFRKTLKSLHRAELKRMNQPRQSKWLRPNNENKPLSNLKIFNSLTRQKDEFICEKDNRILWYSCGPTVYDTSHMGHARCYMSFDILRRVLRDYFGYDVVHCMNITDVDDKIIKKSRQAFLYDAYIADVAIVGDDGVVVDCVAALEPIKIKLIEEKDEAKKAMYTRQIADIEAALASGDSHALLNATRDALGDWLDSQNAGREYSNADFESLPKHFEREYHDDMEALNVEAPDILTRVSEYIPEIVEFVERIIENGFAYESCGSVYFDTVKFSEDKNHFYAKLVPEAFGDKSALEDGEGELSLDNTSDKRSQNDFALWKKSKASEPSWTSPWGMGRPGWHIECSVMASAVFGERVDIHSGGVDLKFPHHDNELAQSEARYSSPQWVNYFLHSGHLHIQGCKMSKSLKNFISIQEALKKNSMRQLRLMFLLHNWKETLDYSDNTMNVAIIFEKQINEFLLTVKDALRRSPAFSKYTVAETSLNKKFSECQYAVHTALCDSIDTRTSLECVRELISQANIYMRNSRAAGKSSNKELLKGIAIYITDLLKVFGALRSTDKLDLNDTEEEGFVNKEELVMPYLDAFAKFREDIRSVARLQKSSEILKICDELRDSVLPEIGVRLEDIEGQSAVIKLVDRETLLKEIKEKKQQEEEKRLLKEKRKFEREAELAEKERLKKLPPSEMFLSQTDKYSKFNDKGMPTLDVEGKELTKSALKKLTKLYEAQAKKFNSI